VLVEDAAWRAALAGAAALVRRSVRATLAAAGSPKGASLTVLLADDARLRNLTARFRGKDAPTNVLSFPAPAGQASLGDVALAFGVCAREAAEQGKPLADHVAHLTAHGVLHLLGYDHETDAEAESMEAKEKAILAGLGVPDPYA